MANLENPIENKMTIRRKYTMCAKAFLLLIFCLLLTQQIASRLPNLGEPQIYLVTPMYKTFTGLNPEIVSNLERSEESLMIYVITPTYKRPEQIPELTRLSHTLRLVKNITWLVIDDAESKSSVVEKLLNKSGIRYEYMLAPMPNEFRSNKKYLPRGVSNRNKGIKWIRNNAKTGIIYFADDDNTYDLKLFEEIRKTKKISMFPVGLVTHLGLSTPIVKNCTFIGFYDGYYAGRKYPVDFAGFAISVEFLLKSPNATIPFKAGYEEDLFLKRLLPFSFGDIELLASCCTEILVWHTQTKKNHPTRKMLDKLTNTNVEILYKFLV